MSKEAPWIRLAVDTLDSPMFSDAGDSVALCWVCLLCWAKTNGRGGRFALNKRAFLARWDRFSEEVVDMTIARAITDGAMTKQGSLCEIVNWDAYQNHNRAELRREARRPSPTLPTQPPSPSADRTPPAHRLPTHNGRTAGGGGVSSVGGGGWWVVGGGYTTCDASREKHADAQEASDSVVSGSHETTSGQRRRVDGPPRRPSVEGGSGVGQDSDASGAIVGQSGEGPVLSALTRSGVLSDQHRRAAAKLDGITPEEVVATAASIRAEGSARNSGAVLIHRLFAKRGLKPPRSKGLALAAASPADRAVNERMQQLRDNRNRGASEGGRK